MKKIVRLLLIVSISSLLFSCQKSSEKLKSDVVSASESMLQHNVYFYLKDSINAEDKREFEKGLSKLLSIDVIHKAEVGITAATKSREVTDHEFEYSIFVWFKTMKDYEVYADHPDHLQFIETYKHLWNQVKVYDSKITSTSK